MARIAVVEIVGPYVRGKKRGDRITLQPGSAELAAWEATGLVRVTYRETGGAAPTPGRHHRIEAIALKLGATLVALAPDAEALSLDDRRLLWEKLRGRPDVQRAARALFGLQLVLGDEVQDAAPSVAPAAPPEELPDVVDLRAAWAEIRQLLDLPEGASFDEVLDAVDEAAAQKAVIGGAAAAVLADEDAETVDATSALLVAELLAHPEGFTLEGVRLVAGKAGIELPEKGTKAALLAIVGLAVDGAAAPPPSAPSVAPAAASTASVPAASSDFLDELDRA